MCGHIDSLKGNSHTYNNIRFSYFFISSAHPVFKKIQVPQMAVINLDFDFYDGYLLFNRSFCLCQCRKFQPETSSVLCKFTESRPTTVKPLQLDDKRINANVEYQDRVV